MRVLRNRPRAANWPRAPARRTDTHTSNHLGLAGALPLSIDRGLVARAAGFGQGFVRLVVLVELPHHDERVVRRCVALVQLEIRAARAVRVRVRDALLELRVRPVRRRGLRGSRATTRGVASVDNRSLDNRNLI